MTDDQNKFYVSMCVMCSISDRFKDCNKCLFNVGLPDRQRFLDQFAAKQARIKANEYESAQNPGLKQDESRIKAELKNLNHELSRA